VNIIPRHAFLVLAVFCLRACVVAQVQAPAAKPVFEYREITGNATYISTNAVDTMRNHLHVHNEDRASIDDYLIDTATDQCVRWTYQPRNGSMHLMVVREGGSLRMSGTRRNGKDIQRTEKLGSAPWAQEWMSFLGAFALSKRTSATFCSLVPPTFDLATFCGQVVGEESITIDGAMVPAVHIRVSFAGKLRIAWHGDYWFRSRDGRFVRFAGSILPGFPESVFELVEKKFDPKPLHSKKRAK
jgi:hypothetical protein